MASLYELAEKVRTVLVVPKLVQPAGVTVQILKTTSYLNGRESIVAAFAAQTAITSPVSNELRQGMRIYTVEKLHPRALKKYLRIVFVKSDRLHPTVSRGGHVCFRPHISCVLR
jgi:hypothetical protein